MQLAMNHASTSAAWAEALFASVLQRSDRPSPGQVRKAAAAGVRAYGGRGAPDWSPRGFGDHPETAVQRMRWARELADKVFTPPPPGPARDSARRRPGRPPTACGDGG